MLLALCRECLLIPDLRHWPRPLICKCLRGLDYINSKFYATSCLLSCFHQFICVWLYRSRLHQHSCQQCTFFFFLLFPFSSLNTLNKYGTLNRTIINCNRKKDQYSPQKGKEGLSGDEKKSNSSTYQQIYRFFVCIDLGLGTFLVFYLDIIGKTYCNQDGTQYLILF